MSAAATLHGGILAACRRTPDDPALIESDGTVTSYGDLETLASRVRWELLWRGVRAGDRVALLMEKSADAVASLMGILMCGAAYVPVDPFVTSDRARQLLSHSGAIALVTTAAERPVNLPESIPAARVVAFVRNGGGAGIRALGSVEAQAGSDPATPTPETPAYLLYTSGSTGSPKGVLVSHRAAVSFARWCVDVSQSGPGDRVLSHAPLHFGLALQDLCMALWTGAACVLVESNVGREPRRLASLVKEQAITIWSSTSSVLNLLERHGRLERESGQSLRLVLFAGEVMPVDRLRAIHGKWPRPQYLNVCGATETNARLVYDASVPLPEGLTSLPLGVPCAGYEAKVVADGAAAAPREIGELWVRGEGLFTEYWGDAALTADALVLDADRARWFRTGDLVSKTSTGEYHFHGRVDRMVKRRGHRVELGEVEAGLEKHADVDRCAVVAQMDGDGQPVLRAFITVVQGHAMPSIIALKRHCVAVLPGYMIPDQVTVLDALPLTSTNKVDYQALTATD